MVTCSWLSEKVLAATGKFGSQTWESHSCSSSGLSSLAVPQLCSLGEPKWRAFVGGEFLCDEIALAEESRKAPCIQG